MKALTKGDIELLGWVWEDHLHPIRWVRRQRNGTPIYGWTDELVGSGRPVTARAKRLLAAGMLVDPEQAQPHHKSGRAELTALGARVLVVYAEHLATHRDPDTALSRTTIDWQQGRL